MEPALKQRLIGAAVLVAIAVIFLPMLIKGPAPESGISDVPLDLPEAPQGGFETRELPLVTPSAPAGASVTGMEPDPVEGGELPTVDTRTTTEMMPAPTAGGGYAVSFGSYASTDDAQRVVDALQASQLPGYQETVAHEGRTLHRVRIGPYDSRATAETARLRAAHVRDDVGSRVLAIDGAGPDPDAASASRPAAAPEPEAVAAEPLPEAPAKPEAPARPTASAPAPAPAATEPPARREPAPAAAAGVGFAVQLGAFSSSADASALRDRARAAGLSAFVEQVQTDKGPLTRVHVGPVVDRAAAEQLKAQVAAKLGINGFVHAHP